MSSRTNNTHRKNVVREMKKIWQIKNIDFMGYILIPGDIITYHHLRIANKDGGPVSIYNGALLFGKSSHPYLHIIQSFDIDMFIDLTDILIEVNDQEYLPSYSQIRRYNEIFELFEREHSGDTGKKGNPIIKEEFTRRLKL